MVLLQFILDTMIKFKKSLSKIISDLEESSPILKNSLLEISPVNFCINIKNHQNISFEDAKEKLLANNSINEVITSYNIANIVAFLSSPRIKESSPKISPDDIPPN